jgi:PKD repeat protein
VTVDSLNSATAITALSDVAFEARAASGAKVRDVRIDFGDSGFAEGPTAHHVYTSAGTYAASATFTMVTGEHVRVSQPVVVRAVAGLWYHAAFNLSSRRVEVRRLALAQNGPAVHGVFGANGSADRFLTGLLSGERQAQLFVEDQTFEGNLPSFVSGESALWLLRVRGGTADGQTLAFRPVDDGPSVPAPTAHLRLQLDEHASNAIMGLDVPFDSRGSTGDGLTHFLEFGDGQFTTDPVAEHAFGTTGTLVAQLTVVDRFGRDAMTTQRFGVRSMLSPNPYVYWIHWLTNPVTGRVEERRIHFLRHEGREVSGGYMHPEYAISRFTGTLSGSRDIRLVLDGGGIEFTGTVPTQDWRFCCVYPYISNMVLTLRGGSADGLSLPFVFYDTD